MHIRNVVLCTGCVHMFMYMQMFSKCIDVAYADGRHMNMSSLYTVLSFSGEIRKKVVPDLPSGLTGRMQY